MHGSLGMVQSKIRGHRVAQSLFAVPVERLIGAARLAMAALALIAISVDPITPAGNGAIAYIVLLGYVGYAALLVTFQALRTIDSRYQFAFHGFDIVIFSVLLHYTSGPSSPFFLLYDFALIAATLRWSAQGALVTTIVLTMSLLAVTYVDTVISLDFVFSANRLMLRVGHLVVAGFMLAYLGAFLERSRSRLARLAAWPQEEIGDGSLVVLNRSLRHAADVIGVEQIVVVWEDRDDAALRTAHWKGQACEYSLRPEQRLRDIVPNEVVNATFYAAGTTSAQVSFASGTHRILPATLDAGFAKEFAIADFCSAPIAGTDVRGRVFLLAPSAFAPGLLHLAEIVASKVAAELEQFGLRSALSMAATVRERVRLARDLHDGVLQNLTAARLMINSILDSASEKPKAKLQEVAGLLAQQQQRIRSFVRIANPKPAPDWDFAAEFGVLAETLQRQWLCEIVAALRPPDLVLPGRIGFEVFLIFGEAMANAVQHGRAQRVIVNLERNGELLHMVIRDDGAGLPECRGGDAPGPFSLSQRVAELGGSLRLTSSNTGVELAIELPIR